MAGADGNAQNFAKLPPERLREISRKGGIASGAARKRQRGLREALLRQVEQKGVQEQLAEALIREATDGKRPGSAVRAFEVIREMIDEAAEETALPEHPDLSAMSTEELLRLLE